MELQGEDKALKTDKDDEQREYIESLHQAVELASTELEVAERAFTTAESTHKQVQKIPRGKAGGGKTAKATALKDYREAKAQRINHSQKLERARRILNNALTDAGVETGISVPDIIEKRAGEAPNKESLSPRKRQRIIDPVDGEAGIIGAPTMASEMPDKEPGRSPDFLQVSSAEHENSFVAKSLSPLQRQRIIDPVDGEAGIIGAPTMASEMLDKEPGRSPDFLQVSSAEHENSFVAIRGGISSNKGEDEAEDTTLNGVQQDFVALEARNDPQPEAKNNAQPDSKIDAHLSNAKRGDHSNFRGNQSDSDITNISDITDEETEAIYSDTLPDEPSDTNDEKMDEDRRELAETFKDLELTKEDKKLYRFMSEEEQKAWNRRGSNAIKKFLEEGKEIDPSIRRMARTDLTFLPEAASTSRTVAVHFLTSKDGNIQCGYHSFKNKSNLFRDGWGKPGMKIRGVPGKRRISDQKKKSTGIKPPAKGLGNCGCRIEDILLEFLLSKRLTISGMVKGEVVDEMMMVQDYMEPRDRSFAFKAVRTLMSRVGMSADDFFTHGNTEFHEDLKIAKKSLAYSLLVLNNLYRNRVPIDEPYKEFVVVSKERLSKLIAKGKMVDGVDDSGCDENDMAM